MRTRDVEWLLRWAFGQESTTYSGSGLQSNWCIVERHCQLGTRIDVSTPGTPSSSPGGWSTHADAKVIMEAVETLDRMVEVDWEQSASQLLGELCHLLPPNPSVPTLPLFHQRHIVIKNAEAGTRPSWGKWIPRPKPALGRNGKPKRIGKRYASDRYSDGACCPLVWSNFEEAVRCRAVYAVWHSALCQLVKLLDGKLSDHVASPPFAPAAPWNMRILQSSATSGHA